MSRFEGFLVELRTGFGSFVGGEYGPAKIKRLSLSDRQFNRILDTVLFPLELLYFRLDLFKALDLVSKISGSLDKRPGGMSRIFEEYIVRIG